MHDLGSQLGSVSWSVTTAVLCGVEALSAQRWAVGAISLCAGLLPRDAAGWGRWPQMNLRSRCAVSR